MYGKTLNQMIKQPVSFNTEVYPIPSPNLDKEQLLTTNHANSSNRRYPRQFPALQAVLEHAKSQSIDEIWNIGDSIGYGAFPDEVIRFLMHGEITSIQGNYDSKVLKFEQKKNKWKKKKLYEKWLAFKFASDHLSDSSRIYLQSLPEEIDLKREGWRILLTHGSPGSPEEHLTPNTPKQQTSGDCFPNTRGYHPVWPFSHSISLCFVIRPGLSTREAWDVLTMATPELRMWSLNLPTKAYQPAIFGSHTM